jgi:hypothetical protein
MSFISDGLTTGMLGYKLRKDFLGEGLFYRETEVYNWKVYARPTSTGSTPIAEIENHIKNAFSSYSGDIKIKALDAPADYVFPNDHIRVAEFNVEIEIKKPLTSSTLLSLNSELSGTKYKGLDHQFFSSFSSWLDSFSEDFSFDTKEDGINVYSHNVSFSLLSGNKSKAQEIITYIFSGDDDTNLGLNVFGNGASAVGNTGNYLNYYNENYDLVRNSYSFSKKREVLPASGTPYHYDLSHAITYEGDGWITVNEKGKISAKITFPQALQGYSELFAGSYSRCNQFYSDFKTTVGGGSVTDSLVNLPIALSRVLNKPSNLIEYDVIYTNDANISAAQATSLEKITDIEKTEEGFINISQNYNYTQLRTPISGGSDTGYVTILQSADNQSSSEVPSLYTSGPFYDSIKPNMNRVKLSINTPNRKKQFGISASYTNNPIYFVQLDGVTYSILEFKITDNKPADILTEYKIINRPNKMSLVNYSFQTEKGSKTVSVSARLNRTSANMFTNPRASIAAELHSLYKYAIGKAMNEFTGNTFLALTYHLLDVKYSISSDNEITLEIGISYAIKRYVA